MGAEFQTHLIEADDKETVSAQYAQYIAELTVEYGTTPYSGELCTLGKTIDFRDEVFHDLQRVEAEQWIKDHHQKWEIPLAVKVVNAGWLIGGWCPY